MSALSRLYGRAAQLRRAWYEREPHRARRLAKPVISVGNLVVGGSGKTPMVATLARLLLEAGERPAILTRGYGRRHRTDGVTVASDGRRVLEKTPCTGDEPQMLARALPGVPVMVAADRYLAGRLAERQFGCTVHLLDDGFQHVQLARDIDLLLVARTDLDESVLPSGRLREPLGAARVSDAVLVNGSEDDAAVVARTLGIETMFRVTPRYDQPRLIEPFGTPLPAGIGRRVVAVAGIARPERFFAALRSSGWDVTRELTFRDHHWFTSRDLESMQAAAAETNADLIITTEKDAMRVAGREGPPYEAVGRPHEAVGRGFTPRQIAFLPMQLAIESPAPFASWIAKRLGAA